MLPKAVCRKEKSRQRVLSGFPFVLYQVLVRTPRTVIFRRSYVIANDIVVPLSVIGFFVGVRQKTQAILCVLPSIFDLTGGKSATENGA